MVLCDLSFYLRKSLFPLESVEDLEKLPGLGSQTGEPKG